MVRLALYLKAELQGVTDLQPASDDYEWFFKVVCNSCHETHPKFVSINRTDKRELSTGHDTANFVWRCSSCKRESSAKFDKFADTKTELKPYKVCEDKAQGFEPIVVLDCRGLEFTEFEPRGTWKCVGLVAKKGAPAQFDDVDFYTEEGSCEWYSYDNDAKEDVSITAIESKWQRMP